MNDEYRDQVNREIEVWEKKHGSKKYIGKQKLPTWMKK